MNEPARELGLRDYQSVLRRRWRWLLVTPLVAVLIVGAVTLSQQRVYEATAEVAILTDANRALFPVTATTADRLARRPFAELEYLSSADFSDAVGSDSAGSSSVTYELETSSPDQESADAGILLFIARRSTASDAASDANAHAAAYISARHQQDVSQTNDQLAVLNANLMRLQEESSSIDAQLASLQAELQNAPSEAERLSVQTEIALVEQSRLARDLAGRIRETFGEITAVEQVATELENTGVAARVHNSAEVPDAPVSPYVRRNLLLALFAGLVLGIAAAIVRDLLDGAARDSAELARLTGAPVLGSIGELPNDYFDPSDPTHYGGYRTVLNSLTLGSGDHEVRTLVVTSATEGVGKTRTVVNLARIVAAAGLRALVIDCSSQSVTDRFSPAERRVIEVAEALDPTTKVPPEELVFDVPVVDIIELFTSGDPVRAYEFERLLEKYQDHYHLVLIDTDAVLGPIDVRPITTKVNAVVVIYLPERSSVDDLVNTVELLRGAGAPLRGLVANQAVVTGAGYQYQS